MLWTKGRFRKLIMNHYTRIETSFSDALMNYFTKISKLPQGPPHLPLQRKKGCTLQLQEEFGYGNSQQLCASLLAHSLVHSCRSHQNQQWKVNSQEQHTITSISKTPASYVRYKATDGHRSHDSEGFIITRKNQNPQHRTRHNYKAN